MVRNAKNEIDLTRVTVSFIPSLKCNTKCSFCMYGAGPEEDSQLSLDAARRFVDSIDDWNRICGWGFYGGEPSINLDLYQKFYELLPVNIPKFIITNGSWSKSEYDTGRFLHWCRGKMKIVISSCTDEHRALQDLDVVKTLSQFEDIDVKFEEEKLHPMGRNFYGGVICSERCVWHKQPIRIALFPTGDVILQNCDGAYPVIGRIEEGFSKAFILARWIRRKGFYECAKLKSLNDIMLK